MTYSSNEFSSDYHDYVFKNKQLLGEFDDMYKYSSSIPWHQDKTAYDIFSDIDISILKHFLTPSIESICDIGCGLGYLTNRLNNELLPFTAHNSMTGIDISENAINKAADMFPGIKFICKNILIDDITEMVGSFDFIYLKDILWYISDNAYPFFGKVASLLKPNGRIYFMQSIPSSFDYVGSDKFPTPDSIQTLMTNYFETRYASITHESKLIGKSLESSNTNTYYRFFGSIL